MIYIFTGNGKGKTSAALGMAFRAAGYGYRTAIVQFMKSKETGEVLQAKKEPLIEIYQFCKKEGWTNFAKPNKLDFELVEAGVNKARELMGQKPFLLILDEFNLAVGKGLVDIKEAVSFLQNASKDTHLVSTGRHAPRELIDLADLVTGFEEIKHPFRRGIRAVRGLDY